ncbi:ROK family protein [Marinimicrobium alkaliphilum]|uniref:ROK family protein n=1 Tax=Marinimicrobium alkaliphilum TaxID=2202654 RepID=UPI001E37C87A|nr:ROK family protein [Marinimicrobium alkaliphilum]
MITPKLYGGLEAGGTKFNCVLAHTPSKILARASFPTTTPEETIGHVIDFFQSASRERGPLSALGIASFGPVDRSTGSETYGYITATPKLKWVDTDLLGQIANALRVPAEFDTDVNGAALGEGVLGAAKGLENYVYVTIGTGVGAGIMANGRPVNGAIHPEVGHIFIPRDPQDTDFPGACPYHGDCLEGLVAGPALEQRWGCKADQLPVDHQAWDIQARYLAIMCINLTVCYSPERIILGGGVMQQGHLFPKIRAHFKKLMNGYEQGPAAGNLENFIVPPGLGNAAGETGALLMAQRTAERLEQPPGDMTSTINRVQQ